MHGGLHFFTGFSSFPCLTCFGSVEGGLDVCFCDVGLISAGV